MSERIRTYGAEKPVAGDLVYDTKPDQQVKEEVDGDKDVAIEGGDGDAGSRSSPHITNCIYPEFSSQMTSKNQVVVH